MGIATLAIAGIPPFAGFWSKDEILNKANYDASSVGVNIGAGTSLDGKLVPQGTSAGYGTDSGDAASVTRSGISGIAGNKDVRTGDSAAIVSSSSEGSSIISPSRSTAVTAIGDSLIGSGASAP